MLHKPYTTYTAEELALDALFVRWVQHPDDDEVAAHWQGWLAQCPTCTDTVETARELVRTASLPSEPPFGQEDVSTVWGRIRESLRTMEDVRPLQPDVRAVVGWWYFLRTVAAGLAVVLLSGWALWMQYGPDQAVRTISTTTESREIRLPDKSIVCLHPHSEVRYARQWADEAPRAVWLQGEADFFIVHRTDTSSARLFRVHTLDLTVEALGTTFRVRQRSEGTRVALRSGEVNLLVKQQTPIRLRPGDSVDVASGRVRTLP